MFAILLFLAQQVTPIAPLSPVANLAAIQLDGSKRLHLVAIDNGTIKLIESNQSIDIPGMATLFTVVDYDRDGYEELWILNDGQQLQQLLLAVDSASADSQLMFSEAVASRLGAMPPTGIHSAQFLRDFNGDGLLDLLLPVADQVRLHLNSEDGFMNALALGALSKLRIVNDSDLLGTVGRVISVPGLRPEEISGDDLPDLVVNENGHIRQYIATENGFPRTPTRTLKTFEFAKDSSEFELDLGNISASAAFLVQDKWADFDNDGDTDLMLLSDRRVHVFLGDENGINLDEEKQRLLIRGNSVYLFPARIDDDEFPDLVIIRVEDVGIGKILRAALMSWEIEFYFMVFRGLGDGTFERRSFRNRTATLEGDSLISTYKEGKEDLSKMRKRIVRTCNIDGDGLRNDLMILDASGSLNVYKDAVSTSNILHEAIEKFLQQSLEGDSDLDIKITTLTGWMLGRTSAMASLANGKTAAMSVTLKDWQAPHAILIRDFDADGIDEAIILRLTKDSDGTEVLSGVRIDFN